MPDYFSKKRYPDAEHITNSFLSDQERWFERAQSLAKRLPHPQVQLMRCMFGRDGSTNELLGSNGLERADMVPRLASALSDHLKQTGHTIARVNVWHREWWASSHNPKIDLVSIRLAATVLKKLGHSSIAAIRIGCLPSGQKAEGFKFHACVQAILIGENLVHNAAIAAAALQRRYEAPRHAESPIMLMYPKVENDRTIAAAAASLLDMGDPLAPVAKLRLDNKVAKIWSRSSKQRALERLKILSLCRLDRLLIATGSFESVLAGLRAGGQARVRKQYQAGDKSLHPDAIIHFWVDPLLRDDGVPLSLPFVKQRK